MSNKQKNRTFLKPVAAVLAAFAVSSPVTAMPDAPLANVTTSFQVAAVQSPAASVIGEPLLIKRADAKFSKVGHYSHSSHSSHASHSSHYSSSY